MTEVTNHFIIGENAKALCSDLLVRIEEKYKAELNKEGADKTQLLKDKVAEIKKLVEDFSASWERVQTTNTPSIPTDVAVTVDKKIINVEWKASTSKRVPSKKLLYLVDVAKDGEPFYVLKTFAGQTSAKFTELKDGQYSFTVQAIDAGGCYKSAKTAVVSATVDTKPVEPEQPTEPKEPTIGVTVNSLEVGQTTGTVTMELVNGIFKDPVEVSNIVITCPEMADLELSSINRVDDTHIELTLTATTPFVAGTISIDVAQALVNFQGDTLITNVVLATTEPVAE